MLNHGPGHFSLMYFPNTIAHLKSLFGDVVSIEFDEKEYPPFIKEKKSYSKKIKEEKEPKSMFKFPLIGYKRKI